MKSKSKLDEGPFCHEPAGHSTETKNGRIRGSHLLGLAATVQPKCALCNKLKLAKKVDVDCLAEMVQSAQDLLTGIL